MKRVNRSNDRFNKWGDARANFHSLTVLGDLATRFIKENHPLFAQATIKETPRSNLASNASLDQLNDGEREPVPIKRGRPRKSNQFYEDHELEHAYVSRKKHVEDNSDAQNEDGQRRKRNVGIPRHFENMVMIEQKRKREGGRERERERDQEDDDSIQAFDAVTEIPKRKRGRPSKAREAEGEEQTSAPAPAPAPKQAPVMHATEEVSSGPKRLTFPEFCEQMRDFFRVLGAWYGVSAPVILHYLREQILPVLRVLSATQLPKETIAELYDQISRTLSYRDIAPSFLSLLSIGRGFPFYAAVVHTLKIYDPDNLYGMRSMHYFVEPPPIQVITIYLRKVVEALNSPNGRETFKEIATIMDEIITEWKDYSIPLERRLEKIVRIDQLLPDHCRGLRARLYHVLMLPTTIMSKVLLQQQLLDEGHVLSTADNMVGPAEARIFYTVGHESLRETGIVPSGIPNTVLFNNVAYIKPVTVHPALATVTALGVAGRVEQPIPVVNRIYNEFPTPEAGPMFTTDTVTTYNTSFAAVPAVTGVITSPPLASAASPAAANGAITYPPSATANGTGQQGSAYTGAFGGVLQQYAQYGNGAYTGANGASILGSPPLLTSSNSNSSPTLLGSGSFSASGFPASGGYASFTNSTSTLLPPPPMPSRLPGVNAGANVSAGVLYPQGNAFGASATGASLSAGISAPLSVASSNIQSALNNASRSSSATSSSSAESVQNTTATTVSAGAGTGIASAAEASKKTQKEIEQQMVRLFLESAQKAVPEISMQSFLNTVKELVRMMRKGEYSTEDLNAKVLLLQCIVPPMNIKFRDEIAKTFTRENIPPFPGKQRRGSGSSSNSADPSAQAAASSSASARASSSSSASASASNTAGAGASAGASASVTAAPGVIPAASGDASKQSGAQGMPGAIHPDSASRQTTATGKVKTAAQKDAAAMPAPTAPMVLPSISQLNGKGSNDLSNRGNLLGSTTTGMATTAVTVRPIPVDSASQPTIVSMPPPSSQASTAAPAAFPVSTLPGNQAGNLAGKQKGAEGNNAAPGAVPVSGIAQRYKPPQASTSNSSTAANWTSLSPADVGPATFANAPPSTFGYDPSLARFKASDAAATKLNQLRSGLSETSAGAAALVTSASSMAPAASGTASAASSADKNGSRDESGASKHASEIAPSSSSASSAPAKPVATGKPIVLNGVSFPFTPHFSYPLMPNSVFTHATAAELLGGEPVFEGTNAFHANGRRAAIAAGPATPGEDKTLQLNKAIAFFFDVNSTNYELSLTVLSEKFRVSHGKIKSTLQREIEQRINTWSDEVCNKLDEALNYYTTRNRKGTHVTLQKAAQECHVPHFHLLVWYIKIKANVNRFRTKPGDFKAKLAEMFIAYYKAEALGIPESRAAISRRFLMTPALFSRKLMDLTDEQRKEYSVIASKQLQEERASAIAAGASAAAANASLAAQVAGTDGSDGQATSTADIEAQSSGGASQPSSSSSSVGASASSSAGPCSNKSYASAVTAGPSAGPSDPASNSIPAPTSATSSADGVPISATTAGPPGRRGRGPAVLTLSAADYVAHTVAVSLANEEKRRSFAEMQGRSRSSRGSK